jgi:hypothetical protein
MLVTAVLSGNEPGLLDTAMVLSRSCFFTCSTVITAGPLGHW